MSKVPLPFHPALAPYVRYCNLKTITASPGERVRNRTQADPWPSVVVSFGQPIRRDDGGALPRAALFGAGELPSAVEFGPGHRHLTFSFYPGAAHPFFGVSLREFTDRSIPLSECWGDDGRLIEDTVAAGKPAALVKALVEEALLARLGTVPAPVTAAVAAAARAGGRASVAELAEAAGRGAEHLKRLFNEWVGLTPKVFSRILRFQALCGALSPAEEPCWAGLAFDFGYAHQSHLIRDFQEFAGDTPSRYYEDIVVPASAARSPLRAFQPDPTPLPAL